MQMINALEAQHHFESVNNVFVFLQSGYSNGTHPLDKYKKIIDCHQLISVNYDESSIHIIEHIKLIRHLTQYSFDNIFLGYFSPRMRRYICNVAYNNIYLIDDGTYTIVLHDQIYNTNKRIMPSMLETAQLRNSQDCVHRFKQHLYNLSIASVFKLIGLKNDLENYRVNFFSSFNLAQYQNETIIKNNYTLLHTHYNTDKKPIQNDNTVCFLGQALHKTLNLPATKYKIYLEAIIEFYKEHDLKINYIPHRERNSEYSSVEKSLESEYFCLKPINKAFELSLLERETLPQRIASFYSSALFTTKNIFPSLSIDAFIIDFDNATRGDIDIIYKALEKEYIAIHKIQ